MNPREESVSVRVILRTSAASVGAALAAGLLMAAACTSASAPAPSVHHPRPETPTQGAVSFEEIPDPSARRPQAGAGQDYLRPRLEEGFALPAYPQEALAANAPPTDVVVRIVVGTDGSVSDVSPSPLAPPPTGDWVDLFCTSVRDAVIGWRYDPCQLRDLEDGPDGDGDGAPDYRLVVASTPVAVYLDIKFRFEIVAGTGRVSIATEGVEAVGED